MLIKITQTRFLKIGLDVYEHPIHFCDFFASQNNLVFYSLDLITHKTKSSEDFS